MPPRRPNAPRTKTEAKKPTNGLSLLPTPEPLGSCFKCGEKAYDECRECWHLYCPHCSDRCHKGYQGD